MLLLLGILWGLWIWTRSTTSTTKGSYSSEQMNIQFTPAGFETYVAELFRERGYEAQLRGGAGDMGVDVELYKWTGERAIVQCKKYKRLVGPEVVRELYGTLQHEQASHAFLVTTARISKSAREWAKGKPITLIDGDRLSELASDLGFPPFEG